MVIQMCPRKSAEGKVAKWAYMMYKDKCRKAAVGPYECPNCSNNNLLLKIDRDNSAVTAVCNCGFRSDLKFVSIYEPIDYYNKIVDQYYHARK